MFPSHDHRQGYCTVDITLRPNRDEDCKHEWVPVLHDDTHMRKMLTYDVGERERKGYIPRSVCVNCHTIKDDLSSQRIREVVAWIETLKDRKPY